MLAIVTDGEFNFQEPEYSPPHTFLPEGVLLWFLNFALSYKLQKKIDLVEIRKKWDLVTRRRKKFLSA